MKHLLNGIIDQLVGIDRIDVVILNQLQHLPVFGIAPANRVETLRSPEKRSTNEHTTRQRNAKQHGQPYGRFTISNFRFLVHIGSKGYTLHYNDTGSRYTVAR